LQDIISKFPGKIPVTQAATTSGSIFSYISPSALISNLFASSAIREKMRLYPENADAGSIITCISQGRKVSENFELQTPMLNVHGKRIFQNDLIEVTVESHHEKCIFYLIVKGFFLKDGKFHLSGFKCDVSNFTVDATELIDVLVDAVEIEVIELKSPLRINFITVNADEERFKDYIIQSMERQHPLKARSKAEDIDVFHVHFTLFSDDTSANVSKKWNKVDVMYLRLASKYLFL
jgi:hypothetical protein